MVLYPNKLPESERVCSGICTEQKEYTTTTLLNDENKRFELKTVCQFYQEQIEQCKVLCKQKIRNSFLNPVFSIYTKYFIAPYFL